MTSDTRAPDHKPRLASEGTFTVKGTPPTDTDSSRGEASDWFKRNADRRNPKAFINTDIGYFADECAAAITSGRLSPFPQSEAWERGSFLGAMGGADYDDFRSAALRSNPGVSTPTAQTEGSGLADLSVDRFVFNWFNERQPEEMRRCLDAYDDRAALGRPAQ